MPLPRAVFNPTLYTKIHDLWFSGLSATATAPPQALNQRWFPRDKEARNAFDRLCKKELGDPLAAIGLSEGNPIDSLKKDIQDEVLV